MDHHVLDALNILGGFLAILGVFYVTYEFFGRRLLKWFTRVFTPAVVGAIILMPVGVVIYTLMLGLTGLVFHGMLTYGLVGVLIGMFNGMFVIWPPSLEQPQRFSWRNATAGFLLALLGWFVVGLFIGQPLLTALFEAGILAPVGGIVGGVWGLLNWEPPAEPEVRTPHFSWRGALLGGALAGVIGFSLALVLGNTVLVSLFKGTQLILSGAILGALWPVCKQIAAALPFKMRKQRNTTQPGETESTQPHEHLSVENENEYQMSAIKPPLFSWKGCVIGLITALLFGFLWAAVANVAFNILVSGLTFDQAFTDGVSGALTACAFIGPGGAITGGISRFIFWRADSLKDGQLGGIGGLIALTGLIVQLVPPFVSYLNIPIH